MEGIVISLAQRDLQLTILEQSTANFNLVHLGRRYETAAISMIR